MKIDYAWGVRPVIERIVSESQFYKTRSNGYWNDRVYDEIMKKGDKIYETAEELQKSFADIGSLTDKFASCDIDGLEDSAEINYYDFVRLEGEIDSFKAESDAIDTV